MCGAIFLQSIMRLSASLAVWRGQVDAARPCTFPAPPATAPADVVCISRRCSLGVSGEDTRVFYNSWPVFL